MTEQHRAKISASLRARNAGRTEKRCPRCGQVKPMAAFMPSARRAQSYCESCRKTFAAERSRKHYHGNPGYRARSLAANREWYLWNRYGLSPADYQRILAAQGGGCAICRSPDPGRGHKNLAVDHDHSTGRVRGLLCHTCNRAVGLFGDDAETIASAVAYLRRSS